MSYAAVVYFGYKFTITITISAAAVGTSTDVIR